MLKTALILTGIVAGYGVMGWQAPNFNDRPSKSPAVSFLFPEQVTVAAGKASAVELHFKVAEGLHINSHVPHNDDLIPTTLKLPETVGVRLEKVDFPAGSEFSFGAGAGAPPEKMSVYTGEFVVHAEIVAEKGEHLMEASLHYQACTNSICLPPKTIPVAIDVIAK